MYWNITVSNILELIVVINPTAFHSLFDRFIFLASNVKLDSHNFSSCWIIHSLDQICDFNCFSSFCYMSPLFHVISISSAAALKNLKCNSMWLYPMRYNCYCAWTCRVWSYQLYCIWSHQKFEVKCAWKVHMLHIFLHFIFFFQFQFQFFFHFFYESSIPFN